MSTGNRVMELAEQADLSQLLTDRVHVDAARVASAGVNPAGKITSIIAGMAAGADYIDDLDVIRSGGMAQMFTGVYAPGDAGAVPTEEQPRTDTNLHHRHDEIGSCRPRRSTDGRQVTALSSFFRSVGRSASYRPERGAHGSVSTPKRDTSRSPPVGAGCLGVKGSRLFRTYGRMPNGPRMPASMRSDSRIVDALS